MATKRFVTKNTKTTEKMQARLSDMYSPAKQNKKHLAYI